MQGTYRIPEGYSELVDSGNTKTFSIANEIPAEYQAKFSMLTPEQQDEFISFFRSTGLSFEAMTESFKEGQKSFDEFGEMFTHFNRVFDRENDFDPAVHNEKNREKARLRHHKAVEKRRKRKRGGQK